MKNNDIVDPFYAQIQGEIDRISKKVDFYNRLFYLIRSAQIALTATITVLAGMPDKQSGSANPILFFGALVTAITAVDMLFQIEGKKSTYKLLLFELRTIRSEFVYRYIQSGKVDDLRFREEMFEKYRKLNAYAGGLMGNDTGPEEKPVAHGSMAQNGALSGQVNGAL